MKLEWVSHSSLQQYLNCSWQFKLERLDKVPAPPAWFFLGGTAVHLATARMDEKNTYPYTDDQLEYIWSEAFNETIAEAYEEWPDDTQWRQAGRPSAAWPEGQRYKYWNERGIKAVKAWHRWRLETNARFPVVAVELPVEFETLGGVKVRGIIDRVHALQEAESLVVFPLDIKTGTKRPASPMQLAIYRQALIQRGLDVADFGAWWMGKDEAHFEVPVSHIGAEEIDAYAQALVKGVENEVFLPNVGDACFMCPFTKQCFAKEGL